MSTQAPTVSPIQTPTQASTGSPAIGNNLHTSYVYYHLDNYKNIGSKDECNNHTSFLCEGGIGGICKCQCEEECGGYCHSIPSI